MKVKSFPSGWLERHGRRLDCGPYISGSLEAQAIIDGLRAPKQLLSEITQGPYGGVYRPPIFGMQFARATVDSEDVGVPFVTGSSILWADQSKLPLISARVARSKKYAVLELRPGMTLISCSGTVGRMAYAGPNASAVWSSQAVMKVVPDPKKVPTGYVYAFLKSKHGAALVSKGTYGALVPQIEREHLVDVPVPRFGADVENVAHRLMEQAAHELRRYQQEIQRATDTLFRAVGLTDINRSTWHRAGRDLGFSCRVESADSLRALNFVPRFRTLLENIGRRNHKLLGELCLPGTLQRGGRFKRIDADPEHSYQLVGQRELFWLRPEGRWIAKSAAGKDVLVPPGTILVAARGTLGESELYCRGEFIWGPATRFAYSEDLLRVIADPDKMPTGCLYAFMRSETAFRMLRSISTGTKLQDHHRVMLAALPVPVPASKVQHEIHNLVVDAYEARHKAVALEDQAITLVEDAIEKGAN